MLRIESHNSSDPGRKLPATPVAALICLLACSTILAQQPPPPDVDALAQEAADFTRGRRLGGALLWGGLILASFIIGWVRWRARRALREQAGDRAEHS